MELRKLEYNSHSLTYSFRNRDTERANVHRNNECFCQSINTIPFAGYPALQAGGRRFYAKFTSCGPSPEKGLKPED